MTVSKLSQNCCECGPVICAGYVLKIALVEEKGKLRRSSLCLREYCVKTASEIVSGFEWPILLLVRGKSLAEIIINSQNSNILCKELSRTGDAEPLLWLHKDKYQSVNSFKQKNILGPEKHIAGEKTAELGEEIDLILPLTHRTTDFVSIPVMIIAAQTLLKIWCQSALGTGEVWYAQAVRVL